MEINLNISIPSSWNELSNWQMKAIGSAYNTTGDVFDLAVWLILNNVQQYQFEKQQQLKTVLQLVPLSELKKHYDYIYKEIDRDIFIDLKSYRKPQQRIFDFTIERFSYADDLNNKYLETNDIKFLRHLAAVLYLKAKETFNWDLQNKRAKRFEKTSPSELIAIHLCWNGVKNHLIKRFPKVYPKVREVKKKNKNTTGFLDVVLQMSGQKFGTYEETKQTRVLTFLAEFNNTIIMHENYEKARSK